VKPDIALIMPIVAALLTAPLGQANAADRSKVEACAPCHGKTGISRYPEIPHIAGQQPDYLIAEMKAFRRATDTRAPTRHWNRRREPIMDHQTLGLTDTDIDVIAAHYAAKACVLPKTMSTATLPPLAQRCVSCHGDDGRSLIATVPHLAGQQQQYLENQLRAFRDSGGKAGMERRTRIDPIMGHQTVILNDSDVVELAAYFSARRCR